MPHYRSEFVLKLDTTLLTFDANWIWRSLMKCSGALFVAMLAFSATTAIADSQMKADKQSVDQACAADAQTAGCGSEQVGSGLMKCMDAYHKAHPEWKPSGSCAAARKTLRAERKADKAASKAPSN